MDISDFNKTELLKLDPEVANALIQSNTIENTVMIIAVVILTAIFFFVSV